GVRVAEIVLDHLDHFRRSDVFAGHRVHGILSHPMRTFLCALTATGLLFAFAASAETSKQFDARIETQLRQLDPAAVEIWNRANVARNAQFHGVAAALYAQVYARVRSLCTRCVARRTRRRSQGIAIS